MRDIFTALNQFAYKGSFIKDLTERKRSLGYVLQVNKETNIVYLPNNTCQIDQPGPTPMNVKDYVRACMNNRHLHTRMRR